MMREREKVFLCPGAMTIGLPFGHDTLRQTDRQTDTLTDKVNGRKWCGLIIKEWMLDQVERERMMPFPLLRARETLRLSGILCARFSIR